jgi:cytochrome c biogenesis protein CcmG, thiol:disulfide interchange protein DsbE
MMGRNKALLFLVGGLLVGLGLGFIVLKAATQSPTEQPRPDPPSTGARMTDFEVEGLSGTKIKLSSFQGKPVVLNFWATWCPPCREEMPLIQSYSKRFDGKVVFIGLNYGEDVVTVQKYVTALKITFPIWLDPNGKVSNLYYVEDYPNTFFIDSQGVLRAQHIGQLSESLLVKYLGTLGVNP